jgi:hypothetical protein
MIDSGLGIKTFCSLQTLSNVGIPIPPGPSAVSAIGTISFWVGTVATIPANYGLCDGTIYPQLTALGLTNPDMRGYFAKAPTHSNSGGTLIGSNTHTHTFSTITTSDNGSHSHTGFTGLNGGHNHTGNTGLNGGHNHTGNTGLNGGHNHITTVGTAHNHGVAIQNDPVVPHTHEINGVTTTVTATGSLNPGGVNVSSNSHIHYAVSPTWIVPLEAAQHLHNFNGNTDNENTHIHNIDNELDHQHTISAIADHQHIIDSIVDHQHSIDLISNHNHGISGTVDPNNNIPEYRELHFIIKLNIGVDDSNVIKYWGGRVDQIPIGWKICDGTLGTPDMRNYFVRGPIGLGPGGLIGGSNSHNHVFSGATLTNAGAHGHISNIISSHIHNIIATGGHNHTTNLTGIHNHTGNVIVTSHNHDVTSIGCPLIFAHGHGFDLTGEIGAPAQISASGSPWAASRTDHVHTHVVQTSAQHDHIISGTTDNESAHTHNIQNQPDHNHTVSLQANHLHDLDYGGEHSHTISNQANHTHTLAGNINTSSNVPAYIELHMVQKV